MAGLLLTAGRFPKEERNSEKARNHPELHLSYDEGLREEA
jgi:hypothetical protein